MAAINKNRRSCALLPITVSVLLLWPVLRIIIVPFPQTTYSTTVQRHISLSEKQSSILPLKHINDFPRYNRLLEFVHIPKTGGTIIESIAARHGIKWTICHFHSPKQVAQMSMNLIHCPDDNKTENDIEWEIIRSAYGLYRLPFSWWHLPPSFFFQYHDILPYNPYVDADLFAVVRNPYDRLISEYYYQQTYLVPIHERSYTQNVKYFNDWIRKKLTQYSFYSCDSSARQDLIQDSNGTRAYLSSDGHFIAQYDFVYNMATRPHRPERIIQHVLQFENLRRDFDVLMRMYGLEELVPLPRKHVRRSMKKELGLHNMTIENVKLIERVYHKDFEEFGYKMQSSTIPLEVFKRNEMLIKYLSDASFRAT